MYFTHHFTHHETLSRAHFWLTRLGFKPHQIEAHREGIPRMAVSIAPQQWAEVSLLISALERNDPRGAPSFWEMPQARRGSAQADPRLDPVGPRPGRSTAIGWHPLD